MRKIWAALAVMLLAFSSLQAQGKLSIDKVYSVYLNNSGTISENGSIKGYFFLYISDKIDRKTNEYTLQILDQNLNKVKDIKFQDSKKVNLLEAAYNGGSLAFFFKNDDTKTLDMKIFDLDGKLKYTYSREYSRKTEALMSRYETMHTDEGMNQNVFNLGDQGYASVMPVKDGKQMTYQVDYYSSASKKQWTYEPTDDEERFATAEYLGSTDSLIILEVIKKAGMFKGKPTAHLIGINFVTKRKVFDIANENDTYTLVPSSVVPVKGTNQIMVLGSYFDNTANVLKDASKGLAVYTIDSKGKIVSKTYNSWALDFAKYLPVTSKGKIDNIGYLYMHKFIQAPNGKFFIVGEGYKRVASAGGIALTALSALGGGTTSAGVTKIIVTDLVMMEFNEKNKIANAVIYDKTNNTAVSSNMSDYNSQHALALMLKMSGSFDYEFTTGEADHSNFTVCYSDWVRSSDYKGQTFNSIHFNGNKFSTDKIELKSKGGRMKVLPAKPGSVMIIEYFKKDKRLDFRLEKLG